MIAMPTSLSLPRGAVWRLLQGAMHRLEPLAHEVRNLILARRARRAQRQAAEEFQHLNAAILADIGIEPVLAATRPDLPACRGHEDPKPSTMA
jgi:hypothetical protein